MRSDHHFPRYHLRPPTGLANDPNGPVWLDGRWHLFFQYTYDTVRKSALVWGHASSADLATWRLHRPALSPDPEALDRDGCWSGNVLVAGDEVIAFYSGYRREHPYQSVLAARSNDGGRSFGPGQQIVADPDPADGIVTFRDPFVWEQHGSWWMVVGAGDSAGRASARLYTSDDLREWTYRGPYASVSQEGSPNFDIGEMWECPQLVSFGDRDALLVGTWSQSHGINQVLALTGTRSGYTLPDPQIGLVDQGPNFYAASALRDGDDGPIIWGWITEGRSGEWAIDAGWSGITSLPRVVSLTDDGRLASAPVASLASLRQQEVKPSAPARYDRIGAQFECELVLRGHSGANSTATVLSLQCGGAEHLDITVDWSSGWVSVDRDHASRDPRAHGGVHSFQEPEIQASGSLSLRWFVDGSVSELFTDSGRCSSLRFYPTDPPPWTLSITGRTDDDVSTVWSLGPQ